MKVNARALKQLEIMLTPLAKEVAENAVGGRFNSRLGCSMAVTVTSMNTT
jgi:hypothetical protein